MAFMNIAKKGVAPAAPAAGAAPSRPQAPTKAMPAKKKPHRGNIGRMLREKLG